MRLALFAALALGSTAVSAQVRPQSAAGDPHLQMVEYDAGQVVQLELARGYQMTIELSPDEQIENVAVGDSGAWQVTANRRGDRLFIKLLQAGVSTNLTVITTTRVYAMELVPLSGLTPNMAYIVRFRYPDADRQEAAAAIAVQGMYRLSGDRSLRPERISDDGQRTYIEWPKDSALPAVYSLDAKGNETLTNGMMRDNLFVLESVSPKLVFRIDRQVARAVRVATKGTR